MPRSREIEKESGVFTGQWQTWRTTAEDGEPACQNGKHCNFKGAADVALTGR